MSTMTEFTKYKRTQIAEMRPYEPGPDNASINFGMIAVSPEDKKAGSPKAGDMIARNPANPNDQWLVNAAYFAANFEPIDDH